MKNLSKSNNKFMMNYLCNIIVDEQISLQKTKDPFYLGIRALIVGKLGVAHSAFRDGAKHKCLFSKKILEEIEEYFKYAGQPTI